MGNQGKQGNTGNQGNLGNQGNIGNLNYHESKLSVILDLPSISNDLVHEWMPVYITQIFGNEKNQQIFWQVYKVQYNL